MPQRGQARCRARHGKGPSGVLLVQLVTRISASVSTCKSDPSALDRRRGSRTCLQLLTMPRAGRWWQGSARFKRDAAESDPLRPGAASPVLHRRGHRADMHGSARVPTMASSAGPEGPGRAGSGRRAPRLTARRPLGQNGSAPRRNSGNSQSRLRRLPASAGDNLVPTRPESVRIKHRHQPQKGGATRPVRVSVPQDSLRRASVRVWARGAKGAIHLHVEGQIRSWARSLPVTTRRAASFRPVRAAPISASVIA